jgi:two-component system sensor histidine kinase/response regulator
MPKSNFVATTYGKLKKINDLWLKLIGSPLVFSLESRIFHSISIGLIIISVIYVPYDFFAGLYVSSLSCLVIAAFFFYQYYNSRFRGKAHSSTLFGLTGIFIFSINYFTNSGINGSTDLIWPAYLLLVFAISPYRQHIVWLIVYLLCFLTLHIVAYYYPLLVKHPFSAGKGELIDRVTAFPIPVLAIYIIIKFIRKSYDKERITVEEKALAIEVQNQLILVQKNQLEQSDVEKNKLMSIISHDLRTPLINIQNYLELLNGDELDSLQRSGLEKNLLTATNSTMDMLSDLLQWSKSQMQGPTVNLLELNLLSAIKSTFEMGIIQAEKKDIAFSYHIGPEITVVADIDMLQLVVRNLISNAIKFTPHGGIINIDAQLVQHECKITVSDNGKGIDEHKQEKIFSINTEPAYGTNNEKGVGLGLLLCKEFIERQGGRIGFESVFGHGSSFYIFIPSV